MKHTFFAMCLSILAVGQAQAACSNAVTAITVLETGATISVTLRDQVTCNPVTVTAIAPAGITPCVANAVNLTTASPPPTKVEATVSATPPSLNFTAVSGATGMGSCMVALQHQDGSNTVSANLSITLSDGVATVVPTTP